MKNLWEKLSYLGVKDNMAELEARTIMLSNWINFFASLFMLSIIVLVLIVKSTAIEFGNFAFVRFILIFFVCWLNIWLNYKGLHTLSKYSLLVSIPFFLLLLPTFLGYAHNEYFFWYQYAPIAVSMIPHLLLGYTKQKSLYAFIGFYFLLVLFIDKGVVYFSEQEIEIVRIVNENYLYYKLSAIIIFTFTNASLSYAFHLSSKYFQKLEESNTRLQEQSLSLEEVNQSLYEKNRTIAENNKYLNELNATKDKFFRIIGHDLKSPISIVISFMDLIENDIDDIDKKSLLNIVRALKKTSEQGIFLLEELLDWARSQTGDISFVPKEINLHDLVNENISMLEQKASEKNIEIQNNIPRSTTITADRYMLNTILRNLINNAIKFSYRYGQVELNCSSYKHGLVLSVSDNGVGVSEEDLPKLFLMSGHESTHGTEDEKGTGLGLIICKEFVKKHGGKIWANQNIKEGLTFNFSIPSTIDISINEKIPS